MSSTSLSPYQHLRSAAMSIDRCAAGTASIEIPEAMRSILKEGE